MNFRTVPTSELFQYWTPLAKYSYMHYPNLPFILYLTPSVKLHNFTNIIFIHYDNVSILYCSFCLDIILKVEPRSAEISLPNYPVFSMRKDRDGWILEIEGH